MNSQNFLLPKISFGNERNPKSIDGSGEVPASEYKLIESSISGIIFLGVPYMNLFKLSLLLLIRGFLLIVINEN
ncbi:ATP synthase subunit alpha chloroplastic [Phtheirospermum japonicum]|uniref:ATP synthase subunit alpha chloroplastic n=1 Tax=Phtheirospermum japonicum TaxID=374723 RepID=A0A830BS46_9LAMI|nr:ATP synthase subunit alpha chloroplastic [Phtheirospermum japonicum]